MAIEVSLEKLIADLIAQETAFIEKLVADLEQGQRLCIHKLATVEQYPGYIRTGSRAHILESDELCRSKNPKVQYLCRGTDDRAT